MLLWTAKYITELLIYPPGGFAWLTIDFYERWRKPFFRRTIKDETEKFHKNTFHLFFLHLKRPLSDLSKTTNYEFHSCGLPLPPSKTNRIINNKKKYKKEFAIQIFFSNNRNFFLLFLIRPKEREEKFNNHESFSLIFLLYELTFSLRGSKR